MSRRTSIIALQEIKEINLTPLIDLTFLLLITFIITFPLIEQGIPVNLPKGKAADLQDQKTRTIALDRTGQLYVEQAPMTLAQFETEIKALKAAEPELTVLVRADEAISYGRLAEVMRILHAAGISRLALVTSTDQAR